MRVARPRSPSDRRSNADDDHRRPGARLRTQPPRPPLARRAARPAGSHGRRDGRRHGLCRRRRRLCWSRRGRSTDTMPATRSPCATPIPAASRSSSRSIRPILPSPTPSPSGKPRRAPSPSASCSCEASRRIRPIPASTASWPRRPKHSFPVNLLCWGRLDQVKQLAARNPNTTLVIDHLGLQQPFEPPPPAQPFADLPKLLALAAHDNVVDQDHRRLHALAPAVPLQGHLGPARAHLRRLRLRSLHVGHRLDARRRVAHLQGGRRGVPRHRPPFRQRSRGRLMGETLTKVYKWAPSR